MPHPSPLLGVLLAAALLPPIGASVSRTSVPGDPLGDASTWYTFAAERFSRTDGATALYESMRRRAGGASRAAVADE